MIRPYLISLGMVATVVGTSLFSANVLPAAPSPGIVARAAAPLPATRVEGRQAVDDAVAAAVIGSISRQFDTSNVTVQLAKVDVRPASIQDRQVEGAGRLRIGGDAEWIPFRFAAMYDTTSTEVSYPRLELGGTISAALDAKAPIARSFDREIARSLKSEFQGQRVSWDLTHATVAGAGRYLRVSGTGTADFGADGSTEAQVQGLYDNASGHWVRVHYELGPAGDFSAGPSVASL